MQTFMTHASYRDTAQILDTKRLGKQRVEAYQIFKALRGDYDSTGAWVNHPATVMWRGNEYELVLYGLTISNEFHQRGFDGVNMIEIFHNEFQRFEPKSHTQYPWWVNDELLHLTHRSNLIRKYPEYYGGFNVPDNIPYLWPMAEPDCFRLGTFKNGDNLDMLKNGVVYLTSKQVAELLGVSPKTISAYKSRNQMPKPDKEYGRTPLWSYSTIEKWRGELRTPVIPPKE